MVQQFVAKLAALAQQTLSDGFPGKETEPVSPWEVWPFSSGADETWLFIVTKSLFILVIFALLIMFIRYVFGPGGALAEPWMREEWETRRQQELADLERLKAEGQVSEADYQRRKAKLDKRK
jgi:uncharacterized membrane protein